MLRLRHKIAALPSRRLHGFLADQAAARRDPAAFWASAASAVTWDEPFRDVQSGSKIAPAWFAGGQLNMCFNALDRHVLANRAAHTALIYDSPVTGVQRRVSFGALLEQVQRCAGVLKDLGVGVGDRVLVYMPMIPEAVVTMLACARLGAIHSVVFGGFAANELALRIDDAKPRVLVTASCGVEGARILPYEPLFTAAKDLAKHKIPKTVIVQRAQGPATLPSGAGAMDWHEAMQAANTNTPCVSVPADHPLYVLYTSGTTGSPKGVVRPTGGHAVALKWSMERLFGVRANVDTWWAASDIGWVVGHSFIVYGPLLHGCSTVLYEGKPVGTPDAGAFPRVIASHKVNAMFCAPTALRAIKTEDPHGHLIRKHDTSSLRSLFLAGERSDPPTLKWAQTHITPTVIDNYWQTETGSPICINPTGYAEGVFPIVPGSVGRPVPGWDVVALRPDGSQASPNELGELAVKLPLPPGALTSLWQRDDLYREKYLSKYPGFYDTSDAGFTDLDGNVHVLTRTDDVINVAGHRLSTGRLEEVVMSHASVAECAVIRQNDDLKGQVPVAVVVLARGTTLDPARVAADIVTLVRAQVGAVSCLKTVLVVPRLPKTRSGKTLRATMSCIINGEPYKAPATIDDPAVLEELKAQFAPHVRR